MTEMMEWIVRDADARRVFALTEQEMGRDGEILGWASRSEDEMWRIVWGPDNQ
jgi:hypothetical protein